MPDRCSHTSRTAIEPSPTAEATRLIEPLRTSPTAKTPGRLVSSEQRRAPGSVGAVPAVGATSRPVRTKPRVVERELVAEPARVRLGADEDEQRARVELRALVAGPVVLDDDRLERAVADQARRPRCGS